ncbi:MAG: TMEM143 family protein [Planctomycetota bacterium]
MPPQRARFLPLAKQDLVAACAEDPRLDAGDRDAFRDLCRILESVFHFEFHARLERLKLCYAPFDPDAETRPLQPITEDERRRRQRELARDLRDLLEAANYEEIPRAVLDAALRDESLFRVRLALDFDDFEELILFRRGADVRTVVLRAWFGLRRKTVTFENFDRVALLVRFRGREWFDSKGRRDLPFEPGATVLKLFRNVPAADLEMLFPNTEVRMKASDMLLIGVPAAIGGIVVLMTKLLGTLLLLGSLLAFWLGLRDDEVVLDQTSLVALAVGLGTLGAFVWKQVDRFKTRKIRFLKALTENLYFKNLDNNAGVLHRLLDEAEEEECKEAILAFWFLHTAGAPQTSATIDRGVEEWLGARVGRDVDFEIEDAIGKLERLDLVWRRGDSLVARPLAEAKAVLDRRWDGYFEFGPGAGADSGSAT